MTRRLVREERPTAITVGVLYILATAAGVAAVAAGAPGGVAEMAAGKGAVLLTALFEVVTAVAVTGIAVMFYPVLIRDVGTRTKQGLTLWYVGTRIAEGALSLVAVVALVSRLGLGEAMADAPARAGQYEAAALALKDFSDYAWVAAQTVFCVGAAMLYGLLYASRRVPRWISVWGLAAAPMFLVAGFLLPFTGDPNSAISTALYAPMGIQEMVLAVWMIGWGLMPSATAAQQVHSSRLPATTSIGAPGRSAARLEDQRGRTNTPEPAFGSAKRRPRPE